MFLNSAGGCSGTPSTWLKFDVGDLFSKPLALDRSAGGASQLPAFFQAAGSGGQQSRGRKRTKPQPTVRERLAKKLLTGRARDRTDSELDAVIGDRHDQLNANRWAER